MTELEVIINQTKFSGQEPIFQPVFDEANPPNLNKKMTKEKKLILCIIIVAISLGVAVIVWGLANKPRSSLSQDADLEPTPAIMDISLHGRAKTLLKELESADPVKEDTPFPPINLEIELDPIKK